MTAPHPIDTTSPPSSDAGPRDQPVPANDSLNGGWVTEAWMTWFAGASAAAAALATGEVTASLVGTPSPVNAIAALFVAPAPDGFVGWSMATFGAGQSTVLVWSVIAVVIFIGAVLGRTSALATPQIADLGFALFGLLAVTATLTTSIETVIPASVASLSAAAIGALVSRLLLSRLADIRRTLSLARARRSSRRSAASPPAERRTHASASPPAS